MDLALRSESQTANSMPRPPRSECSLRTITTTRTKWWAQGLIMWPRCSTLLKNTYCPTVAGGRLSFNAAICALAVLCVFGGCWAAAAERPVVSSIFLGARWMRVQGKRELEVVRPGVVELVKNVSEDIAPYSVIASCQAYESRPGDLCGTNCIFRISRASDRKRQFTIDQGGVVRVAKPLDRETIPQYRLRVEAQDQGGNVGYSILIVNLRDVNDNAPHLYTNNVPIVWEHQAAPQFVAEVFARDPDTAANGPPFTMRPDPSSPYRLQFSMAFNRNGDSGRGSMNVTTKVEFDREEDLGKVLDLPIWVKDSGKPPQEALRYLRVIIGEKVPVEKQQQHEEKKT